MSTISTLAGETSRRASSFSTHTRRLLGRVPTGLFVALAAPCTAAVGTVELTGLIAGLLHSHHGVLVSPLAAAEVLAHWLGDVGVRRGAWPADVAPAMGRFHQVRAALVLAVILIVVLAGGCVAMWRRRRPGRRRRGMWRSTRVERLREVYKQRGAKWATGRELARLHVRRATAGRLTLGHRDGKLLASESNASTLIVAPAQAGKTSGLAVPAMVEWDGPILATSVKGDLLVDTLRARRLKGEVKVFDPTDSTEIAGSAWSPVAAAKSWSAARRLASSILQIGMRQHGGSDDSFWRQAGAAHLAPLLLAGNSLQVSTSVVLKWAISTDEEALREPLRALGALVKDNVVGADTALHDLKVFLETDSRYRSNVIGTLSTYLDAWKEPALEAATAHMEGEGITPEWLLDGSNTLYLSTPAAAQRRLRGLFCALVTEIIAAAFERSAKTGRPLDPRLLLMMDEAANIAPLPNIDEIASTGPGQGVLLCTILQNLSQAEEVWGKDRADTILANHRARLFGAGIADTATLDYITRILGEEARETTSISRKRAAIIDLGTRSESLEHRALLGNHETRQIAEGHALLVYGQLPPTQLQLRPWFKNRRLTRLVHGAAPRRLPLRAGARQAVRRAASPVRAPRDRGPRPRRPVRGGEADRRQPRRVGVTFSVQLGSGPNRQLSVTFQGTPPALTTVPAPAPQVSAVPAATGDQAPEPMTAAPHVAAVATDPEDRVPAPAQLSLEQAPRPAGGSQPRAAAAGGAGDVRGRFERHLGCASSRGVSALRLAAVVGDIAALTGPLALVLQDADEAPTSADWLTAHALVSSGQREQATQRLMAHGAALAHGSDETQLHDEWTHTDGSRLLLHLTDEPEQLEAITAAEPISVDGIGALRALALEALQATSLAART